jgi:hypothetical protein
MTAPTYFELTNNGDLSLYESVNTKEKLLPQREKSTPTDLGMILKPFKVWYLKDFKRKLVLIVHRLVTKSTVEAPFEKRSYITIVKPKLSMDIVYRHMH